MTEETQKLPSPIFKWFERMKDSYELSLQNTLKKFEKYNIKQQERIDSSHDTHIKHLKDINEKQSIQFNKQIERLHNDVNYYREQIEKQQKIIDTLNTRNDSMIRCMLPNKRTNNIKDIFSDDDFLTPLEDNAEYELNETSEDNPNINYDNSAEEQNEEILNTSLDDHEQNINPDELFDLAILKRSLGENTQAFLLFEQAAKLGHSKSMGAMGRSFFLGEGTEEDQCLGLAWLINAAHLKLPQAIERVKHFENSEPALYKEALERSEQLL